MAMKTEVIKMQQYYYTVKAGGFGITCPACHGTFMAEHKRKGVEKGVEICPHCKVKVATKYETEDDSFWDTQRIKVMESGRDNTILPIAQRLKGQAKEDFKTGLGMIGYPDVETRAALRESFKRLHPNATEEQLDIMVRGKYD